MNDLGISNTSYLKKREAETVGAREELFGKSEKEAEERRSST